MLYSTNRIFIESQPLVDGLLRQNLIAGAPRLTGDGFQLVTSLQFKLGVVLFHWGWGSEAEIKSRARFKETLELLPLAFPKLRQLEIILDSNLYLRTSHRPKDNMSDIEAVLLDPLLALSLKWKGLGHFEVAMPFNLMSEFRELMRTFLRGEYANGVRERYSSLQTLWYPLSSPAEEYGRPGTGFWMKEGGMGRFSWRHDGSVSDAHVLRCFGS